MAKTQPVKGIVKEHDDDDLPPVGRPAGGRAGRSDEMNAKMPESEIFAGGGPDQLDHHTFSEGHDAGMGGGIADAELGLNQSREGRLDDPAWNTNKAGGPASEPGRMAGSSGRKPGRIKPDLLRSNRG